MRLVVVLFVAVGVAAQPRPISEDERTAVGVVAAYLAGGANETLAQAGPRDGSTWTLLEAKRDAAFHVRFRDGREGGVWVRASAAPSPNRKAEAVPPHSMWLIVAGCLALIGAVLAAKWRFAGVVMLALATAAAVIAYRRRAPEPVTVAAAEDPIPNLDSRDAEKYYRRAEKTHSFDDLRTAWTLEPKPRQELIRENLLDDLRAKSLVSFFSATEPVRRSPDLGKRAIQWPKGVKAFVTGELLRVEIGTSAIEIPNGAVLAPPDAQVIPATERARRTSPMIALARQGRWAEVVRLTDKAEDAPELLVLRLYALLHLNRLDEARILADKNDVRRFAPNARNAIDDRIDQLQKRRELLANAQTIATTHFDIRHDPAINPAIASRIGDLLEAELARVRKKLPQFEPQRVTVNVLGWDEFRAETQSDHILGLYDGEILFPFASVEQFKPAVVAVITHELTHALLAQATRGNAPRWFHEGVAARMELLDRQPNAFTSTPPGLVLPVPLLDAMMEKRTDQSTYVVAQTFIRFLEDRYGNDVIAKLANGFARGEESPLGKSLDQLNVEFREWGFHHNGEFVSGESWPYGQWYSPGVDPRVRAGFKFRDVKDE